jgi:hypothetical protein
MIVILSPASAASPNVADEVSVAINEAKDLIPILIETCTVPLRMTRMQFIDARMSHDDALRRCLAVIGERAGGAAPAAPRPTAALPADVLAEAERRLTGLVGPIAPMLVARASVKATSVTGLYEILAASIAEPADRQSFLGWIAHSAGGVVTPRSPPAQDAASTAPVVTPEDAAAIAGALIRHLGPIAAQLVRREQAAAGSRAVLRQRLAARIPGEADRAAFLRETEAAPKP